MQTVGAAGIPACGIAARNSASYCCLQWCGQECPHLLQFAFSSNYISFATPSHTQSLVKHGFMSTMQISYKE